MMQNVPDPARQVVFVTGGTGFVGSHLVEELLRRGYGQIRCLVRRSLRWLEGLDVMPIYADLFQDEVLKESLEGVSLVFHVGAVTRAPEWSTFLRENVEAPIRLMDAIEAAAPDVRRVVITSSLAAVGRCDSAAADERSPLHPVSNYGRSKAEMERALARPWNGRESYFGRLPITIVRPPSVYGPREADIYTLFKTANRGIFPVLGSGRRPELSLVHVRDVVRGMVDAAEAPGARGRTYFLGSDAIYSMREVHAAMEAALGRRSIILPVPHGLVGAVGAVSEAVAGVARRYPPFNREKAREARWAAKACSHERAAADFGYRPQIGLVEGFQETVAWYRAHEWL